MTMRIMSVVTLKKPSKHPDPEDLIEPTREGVSDQFREQMSKIFDGETINPDKSEGDKK